VKIFGHLINKGGQFIGELINTSAPMIYSVTRTTLGSPTGEGIILTIDDVIIPDDSYIYDIEVRGKTRVTTNSNGTSNKNADVTLEYDIDGAASWTTLDYSFASGRANTGNSTLDQTLMTLGYLEAAAAGSYDFRTDMSSNVTGTAQDDGTHLIVTVYRRTS